MARLIGQIDPHHAATLMVPSDQPDVIRAPRPSRPRCSKACHRGFSIRTADWTCVAAADGSAASSNPTDRMS